MKQLRNFVNEFIYGEKGLVPGCSALAHSKGKQNNQLNQDHGGLKYSDITTNQPGCLGTFCSPSGLSN